MLGSWGQVGDDNLHCLDLLVLGGDGTDFVRDLVTFHGHVFSIDIRDVYKDVLSTVGGLYKAMTLGPVEGLTHALIHWA